MSAHTVLLALTGLTEAQLDTITHRLASRRRRAGRPWSLPLARRVTIACASLRTNLTMRELAAVFGISRSQVHRIVRDLTERLAGLFERVVDRDRRWSWIVDGTLVPTRDHTGAAKSKNYRWSCNVQVLARRADLHVVAIAGGGRGNRNDTIHYRSSEIERLCRAHGRVLADGGYRGIAELRSQPFIKIASFVMRRGGDIVGDARASNMPSRVSRSGASYAIIVVVRATFSHRFEPSLFFTTSSSNCGTSLSVFEAPATTAGRMGKARICRDQCCRTSVAARHQPRGLRRAGAPAALRSGS